ncbi:protein bfr2-like [Lathyrus oleraceus]|uniref:protein bfr2-like n=1 Tax=Pisum sativum TaxID=3888 RepID=UPI0021CEFB91|nr:protein bfr2-like [Pisum sativum]
MNPSPPPTISGVVQNKGSSTGAQNLEADNAQNEQETSSPGENGKRDSKHVDEKDSAEKEDSEDTPSNFPARVAFPSNDADEDDQDSDEIEGYFQEDEDMNMGEDDPEGNQTGTGDANVDMVPNPIKVRPSITQTSSISLTEEEKKALKQNDPLKNNVGEIFGIKKLISKINITACHTDISEALIDIQNLIDQVCVEYRREVDAKEKLLSTEKAQATEFDNALRTSQASEELAASIKSAQAEFDTYTTLIQLWESHVAELQKKIFDAKAKQTAIQGLDNTEADDLAKQSVDHVEKATAMNEDIARLRGVQAVVQYKIGLAKKKYDRMRATIPF